MDGRGTAQRDCGRRGFSLYDHPDWNHAPEPGSYFHALVTGVSPAEAEIKIGKYHGQIRGPRYGLDRASLAE